MTTISVRKIVFLTVSVAMMALGYARTIHPESEEIANLFNHGATLYTLLCLGVVAWRCLKSIDNDGRAI